MACKVSWTFKDGDTLNKTFETEPAARVFINKCGMLGNDEVVRVSLSVMGNDVTLKGGSNVLQ